MVNVLVCVSSPEPLQGREKKAGGETNECEADASLGDDLEVRVIPGSDSVAQIQRPNLIRPYLSVWVSAVHALTTGLPR